MTQSKAAGTSGERSWADVFERLWLAPLVTGAVLATVGGSAHADALRACRARAAEAFSACSLSARECAFAHLAAGEECRKEQAAEQAEASGIAADIAERLNLSWYEQATDASLDSAATDTRTELDRMNAIAADLGTPPTDEAEVAHTTRRFGLAALTEKTCRADVKCMGARAAKRAEALFFDGVVVPMCQADHMREDATADMARERRNPSGVVSLVTLHNDGESIQAAQAQMTGLLPSYTHQRHHSWPGWRKECPPTQP